MLEFSGAPGAFLECQVTPTDQVLVANDCLTALGQGHGAVHAEFDECSPVVLDRDISDVSDFDAADADEVAVLKPRHATKLGPVPRFFPEPQLSEYRQHCKETQRAHGHKDCQAPDGAPQVLFHPGFS